MLKFSTQVYREIQINKTILDRQAIKELILKV